MRRKKADRIVRVYEQDPDAVLGGGLATLPLAPLTNVSGDAVQGVVDRMKERIDREASRADGGELWAATYVLMGLRYPAELVEQLLKGARGLEDSVTSAYSARRSAR